MDIAPARAASGLPAWKRNAYLLFLLPAVLPVLAWHASRTSAHPDLWAWLPLAFIFGLVPAADWLIGRDPANPAPDDEPGLDADPWYSALPLLCLPLQLALLGFGGWVFASGSFGPGGTLGWAVSLGALGGVIAINAAHELIHKTSRMEQWAGGALLATVGYGGFKVEHVYGHHALVATPEDGSTARLGESAYGFVARAWRDNPRRAWELERRRLARRGLGPWTWRNELFWWHGLSLALAAALTAAFGWAGLAYFLLQGFFAVSLLEVVNYLEHYGLERRRLPDGRWERVTPLHSWNSNFLLTNLLLFQLQRHSDHHAHARRRYQVLRHVPESPQLPAGYATMVLLALAPPLWRRVMDPRVAAFRAGIETAA